MLSGAKGPDSSLEEEEDSDMEEEEEGKKVRLIFRISKDSYKASGWHGLIIY